MFIAKLKTAALITAACVAVTGTGVVVAKQLAAPATTQTASSQPAVQFAASSQQSNPAQLPVPGSVKPATAGAARLVSIAVQARIVQMVQQQPAAYATPENWIIEAVNALPEIRSRLRPPGFVEVVSPWQTLAWDQPTVIEVQYLRTTVNLGLNDTIKLTGLLESGDASAELPAIELPAKSGATAVKQLTLGRLYLAVQVVNAAPQRVVLPEPPVPAPSVNYTRGRIAKIEPGQLTLHVLRGPSGIMRPVLVDENTAVWFEGGQRGTLADLKVDQWIQATVDADWKKALKIEPSTPPWEGAATPVEYKDAVTLLARWLAAIEANDLAAYQQCLHSEARKVNEYGTAEAMVFWARQIKELFAKGFSRQWEFQKPADVTERFPAGSVKAFPIISGKPGRESILLIQEHGQWVIVRLFE